MTTINRVFGCAVATLLSGLAVWGATGTAKISADLRQTLSLAREQRVIVTYAAGLDDARVQSLVGRAGRSAKRFAPRPARPTSA